jgi:trehalose utilization protein
MNTTQKTISQELEANQKDWYTTHVDFKDNTATIYVDAIGLDVDKHLDSESAKLWWGKTGLDEIDENYSERDIDELEVFEASHFTFIIVKDNEPVA